MKTFLSIKELLEGNEFYIPYYHDEYNWNYSLNEKDPEQLNILLSNLEDFISGDCISEYYFGHFLFHEYEYNKFYIIDGVQRLTTILLLLLATINNISCERPLSKFELEILKLIINCKLINFMFNEGTSIFRLLEYIEIQHDEKPEITTKSEFLSNYNCSYFSIKNSEKSLFQLLELFYKILNANCSILTVKNQKIAINLYTFTNTKNLYCRNSETSFDLLKDKDCPIEVPLSIKSGINSLDELTDGFKTKEVTLLAAIPKVGQTSFALSLVKNMAIHNTIKIGYISLKDDEDYILNLISDIYPEAILEEINTEISSSKVSESIAKHYKLNTNSSIHLVCSNLTISELWYQSDLLSKEHEIDILIIDFVEDIKLGLEYIYEEVYNVNNINKTHVELKNIYLHLKDWANDLNLPIIALSKLGDIVGESGGDFKPKYQHITAFNLIDKYVNDILFLYRPHYYGFYEDDEGNDITEFAEIIRADKFNKYKEVAKLRYDDNKNEFSNFE